MGDTQSPAPWTPDELAGAKLAADVLGTLFLDDPDEGKADALLNALAEGDARAMAASWPFAQSDAQGDRVCESLTALCDGARRELEARAAASAQVGEGAEGASEFGASDTPGKNASSKDAPTPLACAYRRLFVGPGHLVAPPWGSVYTDRDCVTFGMATLDLRAWMRVHGISMEVGERVPEDHIGLLLGQMGMLCQQAPELLDEFLRLHVLTWSHHYLLQLAAAAEGPWDTAAPTPVPATTSAPAAVPVPVSSGRPHGASRFERPWAADFYRALANLADETLEGIRTTRHLQVVYPTYYR